MIDAAAVRQEIEKSGPDGIRQLLDQSAPAQRKLILREVRRHIHREHIEIADLQRKSDRAGRVIEAYEELNRWLPAKLVLERPAGSVTHHLRQEMADGDSISFTHSAMRIKPTPVEDYESEIFADAQFFVVTHDWAAAFAGARDFTSDSEFKLPADVCVFEFKVSGRNVVIMATDADGACYFEIMVRGPFGWFVLGAAQSFDETETYQASDVEPHALVVLGNFLRPQIRAISVALEAEVAETEVVRAPHKLNRAREKAGRVPANDYHIVELIGPARLCK